MATADPSRSRQIQSRRPVERIPCHVDGDRVTPSIARCARAPPSLSFLRQHPDRLCASRCTPLVWYSLFGGVACSCSVHPLRSSLRGSNNAIRGAEQERLSARTGETAGRLSLTACATNAPQPTPQPPKYSHHETSSLHVGTAQSGHVHPTRYTRPMLTQAMP